nr:hypothetical protein [Tanacetum cinerariifolium]
MDTTIDQQVAMDVALDVLRLTPFFKAFLVTVDVPEIYMQEFWGHATYLSKRLPGQSFIEPPFKEEILAFIRFLGHSAMIRKLVVVNINKLYQPWRSFAAIINKCLTGKSSGYDSLRLSQAQILWGLYRKRNVDFAYLMWEDFIYQVEHKDTKKSNDMYYPWFTKVIIHHFMLKDPSIPRRNKKTRSSSDTTITPSTAAASLRLTTSQKDEGTGSIPEVPDVPTDESEEELPWNSTDEEGDDDEGKDDNGDDDDKDDDGEDGDGDDEDDDGEEGNDDDDQEDEGDNGEDDEENEGDNGEDDEENEGGDDEQASDEEEFIHPSLSTHAEEELRDEESFDPILKTPKDTDDEDNGEEDLGLSVGREEGHDEEEEEDELYRDVNINQRRGIHTTQEVEDSHVTLTPVNPDGQQQSSSVSLQFVTSMLNLTLDAGMESIFETTSQMDVQTPTSVAPLPMFAPTITSSTI